MGTYGKEKKEPGRSVSRPPRSFKLTPVQAAYLVAILSGFGLSLAILGFSNFFKASAAKDEAEKLSLLHNELASTARVAGTTSRINISRPIRDMVKIKDKIFAVQPTSVCVSSARINLLLAAEVLITGYEKFAVDTDSISELGVTLLLGNYKARIQKSKENIDRCLV